jgi:hypothetical protein
LSIDNELSGSAENEEKLSDALVHSIVSVRIDMIDGNGVTFEFSLMEASHPFKSSLQLLVAQMHNVKVLAVSYDIRLHLLMPVSTAPEKASQLRVLMN